jgi:ligand-binding sensor domain-containing protein
MKNRLGLPATSRGLVRSLTAVCMLGALPDVAGAAGAWQTFLHARDFTDLVVTSDAVWCATAEAGLLRFDRTTHAFQSVTREPGTLASNHLSSLAFDRLGRLWVGTIGSGVSRLTADGTSWELVNAFDGLPVDSVTTITVAGDTLWIGTRRGIALWDGREVSGSLPDGNTVSFDTTFVLPAITGVEQLGDTLWLATPRGVGFASTTTHLSDWRPANAGLPTIQVEHLASDGQVLFAQAAGSVYQWDPQSLTWSPIGGLGTVHSLKEDYGTVLAGTSLGIWSHRAGSPSFTQITDSVVAASTDGDDPEPSVDPTGSTTHYAGSSAGLWEEPASPGAWTDYPPPGPPGNTYSNIVIDGPRVYAATRDEGIGRWDGTSWYPWLPGPCFGPCPNSFYRAFEVFAMLVDPRSLSPQGEKWVSCWGFGLDRFDDSVDPPLFTHLWTPPGDDVRHTIAFGAAADSNGGRWFGMDTYNEEDLKPLGLDHYDSTGAHAETWSPGAPDSSLVRGGKIRAVTVDKGGRIWVGYAGAANSGVDHFVRRPKLGYDFKTVANTTNFDVWGLVAHGDSIWLLTDHELRRINRAENPPRLLSQKYETPAGRPLVGVRLMDVAPNGEVFVGSEEGVRWYRRGGASQDFTVANSPLAANDVRAIAVDPATGVVWFGTAEGLNRFDPGYRAPAPPLGVPDSLRIYPNPATLTGLGVQLRLRGVSAGYSGGIYDLRGRLLHRFRTTSRGQVFWDGRDDDGVLVKPGIYFVRAEGGGRQARARFALLH